MKRMQEMRAKQQTTIRAAAQAVAAQPKSAPSADGEVAEIKGRSGLGRIFVKEPQSG
jgi:hypothetical protein